MKKYINTSNYYLSTITSKIESSGITWTFDVSDVAVDWVTLPTQWYYWVDVDFWDVSKREIFRIVSRDWYTLTYDARISPYGMKTHSIWATVWLRDFSQLLNSLSTNTDNFWEVEKTWDRTIRVRGGKIFASGNATMLYDTVDTDFTIPINSVKYIVLDYELEDDGISIAAFTSVDEEWLTATGKYPIAKITTNANIITEILDLRSNMIYWGGEWDMKAAMYDPNNIASDAFAMDNMEQWDAKQYVSPVEKEYWSDKQEELVSWQNIVTINGKSIIDVSQWEGWNIPLDTILTAGWETAKSTDWANTFIFWVDSEHLPLTESSFIVFSDSGTMLTEGWLSPNDYTYNNETHTITFNSPLAFDEHAIVWLMYNNTTSSVWIGSWTIQLQRNWVTITNWQFNVNQDENQTIELWDLASDASITFTQWWVPNKTITLNQAGDDTVALSWMIPVSQEDYEDLPDTKLTDNQWYFIYEEE